MILLQPEHGLHELRVAAVEQAREDMLLFVFMMPVGGGREELDDFARHRTRFGIGVAAGQPGDQGRELAEGEEGLTVMDVAHVEAVGSGRGIGSVHITRVGELPRTTLTWSK